MEVWRYGGMEIPRLDALLADYAAWRAHFPDAIPLTPSPTTLDEFARIEAELGVTLPADYQALALRYNLAAVEFNYSQFFPPVSRRVGDTIPLFDAFVALLTDIMYPFSEEHRRWGVAPVADDNWDNVWVIAVRQPTAPQAGAPDQPTHPLAPTRPYGSVWAYYPDEMLPSMRYIFEYVSASFTQALHMALLCWRVWRDRKEKRGVDVREADLRDALITIDPTVHATSYWQGWIEGALE
jgi:SMI1/KNR4 family protein SUKH-1